VPEDFSYDDLYCYGSEETLGWILKTFGQKLSDIDFLDTFSSSNFDHFEPKTTNGSLN
jgi:hypothetical protein